MEEALQVLEVGPYDPVDGRILDLDGHGAAIFQSGPVDLPDGGRGIGLFFEICKELSDWSFQGTFDFVTHDLGGHARSLLLEQGQHFCHFWWQHRFVQAEHLTHLHGGALHLAQGLDDAQRVLDQVLGATQLLGGSREGEVDGPLGCHGGANPPHQTADLDDAP